MSPKTPRLLALLAFAGGMAGCGNGAGPTSGPQVNFNIGTRAASGSPIGSVFISDTVTNGGADTVVVDQVELVLRDIRFKRVEDSGCPDDDTPGTNVAVTFHNDGGNNDGNDGHADACESFNAGPFLLDLPLGPGVDRAFSVAVDTGTYDQLRIKIHKPRDDNGDQKDIDFLVAHPDFAGISIRVTGSYNHAPFSFTSDLEAEERIRLNQPLIVPEGTTSADLTIKVDLAGWFKDAGGNVIDPNSANKGGENENLVKDNIRDSFHAFRDDNHDCHDDDGNDDN
jgi:hypothetical protein